MGKRLNETQIVRILKEAKVGTPIPELCRKYSIGNRTFYKWRSKYGGMESSDVKRLEEMSFFQKLFGGGAISRVEAVGNIADKLFTSDEERAHAKIIKKKHVGPSWFENRGKTAGVFQIAHSTVESCYGLTVLLLLPASTHPDR